MYPGKSSGWNKPAAITKCNHNAILERAEKKGQKGTAQLAFSQERGITAL